MNKMITHLGQRESYKIEIKARLKEEKVRLTGKETVEELERMFKNAMNKK